MAITTGAANLDWRRIGPLVLAGITVAACSSTRPSRPSGSRAATNSTTATRTPTPGRTAFSTRGGGVLVAVDARTGRQKWRTELPMATVSEPVLSGGLLVVTGTEDCAGSRLTVAAVRADTGQPAWQSEVTAQNICGFGVSVHVAGGNVVAGGPLGGNADFPGSCATSGTAAVGPRAVGLNLSTGKQRWQAPPVAGEVLAATSDTVIVRGANQGCLVGLDAATGHERWTVAPPVTPLDASTVANSVFVLGQVKPNGDAVSSVDHNTGRKQWQVSLGQNDGIGPLVVGDVILASTYRSSQVFPTLTPGSPKPTPPDPTTVITIICLDPASGHQLWSSKEHDNQLWTSLGPGLVLITHVNTDRSTVEARDSRSGARRWQSASIRPGVGARTDGAVVVALTDRSAAAFTAAEGRSLWTFSGGYTGAVVTSDTIYLAAQTAPKNPPQGD